jgi:(2R)-sulfolactate sulfo-lyase subunit alpha
MIHFIAHGRNDNVGVAVADLVNGMRLTGWNMETDETLEATAGEDIPLGHKIALAPVPAGGKVIKYNVPIGKATQDIAPGRHVHTHCLKTARW